LRKVKAIVQKRSLRKLAGLGEAGALLQYGCENSPGEKTAAVAV
jgi:hypothetical protein